MVHGGGRSALEQWIRRKPVPTSLRIRTSDDETNVVEINASSSQKWKMAVESIKAARAIAVECLDAKGRILRARELEDEGADADPEEAAQRQRSRQDRGDEEGGPEAEPRQRDRAASAERKEMAQMLDRYGDRLNEAFERGADAAGKSHEALVALVGTLTANLNTAIVNLHTISTNFAKTLTEYAGVENGANPNDQLMAQVVAGAIARATGGGGKKADGD